MRDTASDATLGSNLILSVTPKSDYRELGIVSLADFLAFHRLPARQPAQSDLLPAADGIVLDDHDFFPLSRIMHNSGRPLMQNTYTAEIGPNFVSFISTRPTHQADMEVAFRALMRTVQFSTASR